MKPFLSILLLTICCSLSAQQEDDFSSVASFSFSPQYMIKNGLKVSWEKKINDRQQWIRLAPQLYYDESQNLDYEKLMGWGIDIDHKIFLESDASGLGSYFSYGATYQSYRLDYQTQDWIIMEKEGLTYHEYKQIMRTNKLRKTGPNVLFGYRWMPYHRLFIDFYLGAGLRISFHSEGTEDQRKFNDAMTDFGYSGTLFKGGIQFGVLF